MTCRSIAAVLAIALLAGTGAALAQASDAGAGKSATPNPNPIPRATSPERVWPPIADTATAPRVTGRWVWGDLLTHDVAASRAFYGKVFGWTFETLGEGRDSYTKVLSGGRPIAGMLSPRTRAMQDGARWIGLVSVPDAAASATQAAKLGGTVVMSARTLAGRGDVALLADPGGAQFAVIRTAAGDPIDVAGRENEWLWVELWASDPAREAEFYRALLGYGVEPVAGRPAGSSLLLTAGGRARAGVLRKPEAELPTEWIPYVRVRNVLETVERALAAGARVVIAPTPHHKSRTAVLVDPLGAPFAVAEWRPQP